MSALFAVVQVKDAFAQSLRAELHSNIVDQVLVAALKQLGCKESPADFAELIKLVDLNVGNAIMQVWRQLTLDGAQALRRVAYALTHLLDVERLVLVGTRGAASCRRRAHCLHMTLLLVHAREVVALWLGSPRLCDFQLTLATKENIVLVFKEILTELVKVAQIRLVVFEVPLLRRVHDLSGKLLIADHFGARRRR